MSLRASVALSLLLLPHFSRAVDLDNSENEFKRKTTVFQGNQRRPMTQANGKYLRAVGKFFAKMSGSPGKVCTATLIGRDLILTNAHCVTTEGVSPQKVGDYYYEFVPHYGAGRSSVIEASLVDYGAKGAAAEPEQDWAILRLDEAVGDSEGWIEVREVGESWATLDLTLVGYSKDFQNGEVAAVESGCRLTRRAGALLRHGCSTFQGSSGGPLLAFDPDGTPYLLAVHRGGANNTTPETLTEFNANSAVSASVFRAAVDKALGPAARRRGPT